MKAKGLITDTQYSDFFTTCYGVHRNEVKSEFSFLDSDKLIELVHAAGGIACVAHPTLLCEKPDADEVDELIQCAKCSQIWAGKVGGADSPRARKLSEAIDLAAYDKCPTEDKDKLCNVSEDEGTDEETCARCILRWATIPFAKFK